MDCHIFITAVQIFHSDYHSPGKMNVSFVPEFISWIFSAGFGYDKYRHIELVMGGNSFFREIPDYGEIPFPNSYPWNCLITNPEPITIHTLPTVK
jgi:hypothetical protein